MKHTIITITALAVTTASLLAATPIENELAQLQSQHAKALAAAAESVNRRQIAALEMLQRKATQAGELETAFRIKAQLAEIAPTTAAAKPKQLPGADVLERRLVGTKWVWFEKETITFKGNGKAEWVKGRELWPWTVKNVENRVISGVHGGLNKKFTITFDEDFKKGRIAGEDGERSTRNVTSVP